MNKSDITPTKKYIKYLIILFLFVYLFKVNQYAIKYLLLNNKLKDKDKELKELIKKEEEKINDLNKEINNNNNNNKRNKGLILNRCINEKVPKVSGLLETAEYLRYHNKSLIRYGDGEISLMMMKSIPRQYADNKLKEELLKAFNNNNNNVMIGIRNIYTGFPGEREESVEYWLKNHTRFVNYILSIYNKTKRYFDAFITSPYTSTYNTSCELVDLVYKELREVWRDKDLVILRGNNSQVYEYDVYNTAKSQKIFFCARSNVWNDYKEIMKILLSQDPSSLYIISAGPVSEVIVMDLVKENRRALDMGHLAKDYNNYMKNSKYSQDFWID